MRTPSVFAILSVVALAASAYIERVALAQDPIEVEPLTPRAEFSDDVAMQIRNKMLSRGTDVVNLRDASNVVVVKITIQPQAVFPWHTHPGPVLISVAEGDFVYVLAEDCLQRRYREGQALIDAGFDNVHTAFNPSDTEETIAYGIFLGAPHGDPLTIPVPGPDPAVCPLPTP